MSRAAPQRIVRIRREYNQWVANQTLEDYALRFTAKGARRWSPWRVANTALGAMSFLALEAIGGAITLNYGFTNALWAILVAGALIFASGLPIAYYAAKYGVDMDLLTRGAGFGYLGSTITSLIYASFTFIFFALEAAIMAMALELCFGLPLAAGYVVCALAVIPLVTHGITLISRFQAWTQPLWLLLNLLPFAFIAWKAPQSFADWTTFTGRLGETQGQFDLLLFGSAASVVFALVPQIGEQVDFLRFLPRPRQTLRERAAWWSALVAAGPGWIVLGVLKMLAGSFLLFLAVQAMVPLDIVGEPVQMYLVAFREVFSSPMLALAATTLFVIVAQLKINVTNAYAGSIAWSNFFARLTHSHPGRVVWLAFNVLIALVLMELGVFKALERILGLYANVAIAWIGAVVADLVINKPLGLSPRHIEFKRAHLYDINPVGVGAMGIATAIALLAYSGLFGPVAQALSTFVAFGTALLAAPLIAWATGGRYYIARAAEPVRTQRTRLRCVVCEHRFEVEDMARCPAYGGWICSLCCSLDARCLDSCKPRARLRDQLLDALRLLIPERGLQALDSRLGHYIGVYSLVLALIGGTLLLLGFQQSLEGPMPGASALLWKAFAVLSLIAGVVSWLFVLAQESRSVAQQESSRQMQLLTREIQAHKRTDAQLKEAKEAAEAANLAKSRFVTGLSHELRTPLNAILGYAQLMDGDRALPEPAQDAARVIRRSGEHLSQLIDGLLDIAKIEAGKVHLHRDLLHFPSLIDELEMMFGPQARAKGIGFRVERPPRLPVHVQTDGKRLRQVLINLLTNAIKFTEHGSVTLRLRYQRQTAEFQVIDTGPGIAAEDRERIFAPFERGRGSEASGTPGMGLGLTISRVLTEIMGGQISVASEPGVGSTFSVRMVLGEVSAPAAGLPLPAARIVGYEGPRRSVLVADDDDASRALLRRLLEPLGFSVQEAARGDTCLDAVRAAPPDVLLLDISMPGLTGWEVARRLRAEGQELPIVMVSADAFENRQVRPSRQSPGSDTCHDDFLVKPINLQQLLDALRRHLGLAWRVADGDAPTAGLPPPTPAEGRRPAAGAPSPSSDLPDLPEEILDELDHLVAIGHVRGLLDRLDALAAGQPAAEPVASLRRAAREFRLADFQRELAGLRAATAGAPAAGGRAADDDADRAPAAQRLAAGAGDDAGHPGASHGLQSDDRAARHPAPGPGAGLDRAA
jgi:signal transduction histidine kinase/CheY-like chemotaxis protein